MTIDDVVSFGKSDFVAWLVETIIEGLGISPILSIPVLGPFILALLFKAAGVVADKIDLGGYFLYKSAKNNIDAGSYLDSIRETNRVTALGDSDAIAKARATQRERFSRLMLLTS